MSFEQAAPKKRKEYKKDMVKILQEHRVKDPNGRIGLAKMKALGLTGQKWLQYELGERERILQVFGEELSKDESG